MILLGSFYPEDIDPTAPHDNYDIYQHRQAARAVVMDGEKIALLWVSKSGYYMLPGGGIENNDVVAELKREILEELGCNIKVAEVVGMIEVYFDHWQHKQVDICYIAHKLEGGSAPSYTKFEQEEGFEVFWASSLSEAIELVKGALPRNRDGKLIQARDLRFLQAMAQTKN